MKDNKEKIITGIVSIVLLVVLYFVSSGNLGLNNNNIVYTDLDVGEKATNFIIADESDLQIIYFDVGNADSILIKDNKDIMLIDAGNHPDGKYITQYLKDLGITEINYLIGTHEHEDHIGGMDYIIKEFQIDNIFLPDISKKDNRSYVDYDEVITEANRKGIEIIVPIEETQFYIGDSICIVNYIGKKESNPNNNSIVIELENNGQKYLFTGDIEEKVEKNIIWDEINVLKVAHHGSSTSTSIKFLEITKPQISIISVGTRSNLLDDIILQRLEAISNNKIYITKDVGSIYITNKNGINMVETLKTKVDSTQH